MEDLPKIVARNVLRLRHEMGLSQEKLADQSKIDRSYFGKIERGEANLTIKMVGKVALGLRVQPSVLFELPKDHAYRRWVEDKSQ